MNRATPIVLVALLALLGLYVAFFEIRPETRFWSKAETRERSARVFDVERSDALARSIRLLAITQDNNTIAFERTGAGAWHIAKPIQAPAVDGLVSGLVSGLLFARKSTDDIQKTAFPPNGLVAYGLDKPSLVVLMKAGEGKTLKEYSLRFGGADPTKHYVYAQRPDDSSVMVLDKVLVEGLTHSLNEYREAKFVGFDSAKAAAVKIRTARGLVELEKQNDTWIVTGPYRDRADSLRFEDVRRAVEGVEARSFPAEAAGNLAPFGLDLPAVEFSFTRDDNSTATLLLGKPAPEPAGTVYATLAGQSPIYTVSDDVVKKLTFDPVFLRDRQVARLSSQDVSELTIERPGQKFVIRKALDKWKIEEPVKMDAEPDAVDAFVRALAALEIVRFPNDAPDDPTLARFGLDPKSRIAVTVKIAAKPLQVYYVGAVEPATKDLYMQRKDSPSVYTVSEGFRKDAESRYLDFRVRSLGPMSRYNMQKIAILRPQGPVTIAKESEEKWRMVAPVNAPAFDAAVGRLLDDLNDLAAVKFIAEKVDRLSDYGLDKPPFEVAIDLKPVKDKPPVTRTLLIGKEFPGEGCAAKFKDADLVFTVSESLVQHLGDELRKHVVWQFERGGAQASALVWQTPTQKVSVRREQGAWKLIEPRLGILDEQKLEGLINAVSWINVDRFESYTKDNLPRYGLTAPRVTVTVTVDGKDRTFSLGGVKDANSSYGMVSDDDPIFTLPANIVRVLLESPLATSAPR